MGIVHVLVGMAAAASAFVASPSGSTSSTRLAAKIDEAVAMYNEKYPSLKPGKLYYVEDSELKLTYQRLASVYGEDIAFEMCRRNPSCLAYNRNHFQPSLDAFSAKFGEEEARAMVFRNPNLLAVPPTGYKAADAVGDDAMLLSYVVAATRPLGPVLLPAFFLALLTPSIEVLSGMPLRSILLGQLTGH